MLNLFIINENAGRRNADFIYELIKNYCDSKNIDYQVFKTTKKEDTKIIIDKYKDINDLTIHSIGGDGTLNEIVNCIAKTDIKLNIIPAGTGNDFYRSLNGFDGSKIDLGKVNDRYFINVASVGIDAEIASTANNLKISGLKGKLVYPTSIVKNLCTYKNIETSVDKKEKYITLFAVCNAMFYGGGFNISPNSRLDDGLFDVYEIEKLNKLEILKLFSKLIKGTHFKDKKVNIYRTNKVNITSKNNLKCNVDGEILVAKELNFSIIKKCINLDNDELGIKKLLKKNGVIK